jgi:rare lipoprotein A
MTRRSDQYSGSVLLPLALLAALLAMLLPTPASAGITDEQAKLQVRVDHSGQKQRGKASYYNLPGRKMADGTPMNPASNIAASKTLPLGTKAKVTNLDNGKSVVVVIRDRGPFVQGRIVDVTPKTAEDLGMRHSGVAAVEVVPLEVPQRDGTVKVASNDTAEREAVAVR